MDSLSPRFPYRRSLLGAASLALGATSFFAQEPATARPKDPVAHDAAQTQSQPAQQPNQAPGDPEHTGQHLSVPGSVALSPDGKTVAWTLRGSGSAGIHLTDVAHPQAADRQVTISGKDTCAYSDPIWSPDSSTLAFLGACAPESADPTVPRQGQIYLWSKTTGQTRQLTHVTGDINQPAWSPDSKAIGFLFVENATRTAGALDAMKPWSGVIGEDGVEIQRVSAVDTATGTPAFLTPANLHVYEFDWAPTSREIAFIAANPPGENNWWIAKLYTRRTGVEDTPTVVFDPTATHAAMHGLQMAVPRFSPDGSKIAFIGGLMSDQGSTGGDLWTVEVNGEHHHDVTPDIDGTPVYETWIDDHTLGFVEDRRGHTLLNAVNLKDGKLASGAQIDLGEVSIGGGPIKDAIAVSGRPGNSKDRVTAFTLQGFNKAPEIYTLTGAATMPQQLTHLNPDAKPSTRTESVEWTNGTYHVQGWLTFPTNYDPAKKYPVIVQVHGGPSASIGARWSASNTWAEHGYFDFQPNPRGSFGQGEAFTQANRKDFGYGDLKDIEAGLDFIESKYPIDHNREGITGWSYGGFMTMFSVTQTHRFKAAVAGAGLSDWLSYYGENSIDQWMIPFFGASVYDDPAVYAKSSAINYIKNVTTPTLVIVGDRDGECPAPQSFEFWHALRDLGVKTQLVVYPDEGHGFRNPEHIRDRNERMVRWFAENMPAAGSSTATATGSSEGDKKGQ